MDSRSYLISGSRPLPQELTEAAAVVWRWASETPAIRRVFFFGSRIVGTASPESDLDIALDADYSLMPARIVTFVEEDADAAPFVREGYDRWLPARIDWRRELDDRFRKAGLPLVLDLSDAAADTPTTQRGLQAGHVVVYDRRRIPARGLMAEF